MNVSCVKKLSLFCNNKVKWIYLGAENTLLSCYFAVAPVAQTRAIVNLC